MALLGIETQILAGKGIASPGVSFTASVLLGRDAALSQSIFAAGVPRTTALKTRQDQATMAGATGHPGHMQGRALTQLF